MAQIVKKALKKSSTFALQKTIKRLRWLRASIDSDSKLPDFVQESRSKEILKLESDLIGVKVSRGLRVSWMSIFSLHKYFWKEETHFLLFSLNPSPASFFFGNFFSVLGDENWNWKWIVNWWWQWIWIRIWKAIETPRLNLLSFSLLHKSLESQDLIPLLLFNSLWDSSKDLLTPLNSDSLTKLESRLISSKSVQDSLAMTALDFKVKVFEFSGTNEKKKRLVEYETLKRKRKTLKSNLGLHANLNSNSTLPNSLTTLSQSSPTSEVVLLSPSLTLVKNPIPSNLSLISTSTSKSVQTPLSISSSSLPSLGTQSPIFLSSTVKSVSHKLVPTPTDSLLPSFSSKAKGISSNLGKIQGPTKSKKVIPTLYYLSLRFSSILPFCE